MKLIVAGSRSFTDYNLVRDKLDYYLKDVKEDVEIVSGRCSTGEYTFTTNRGDLVYGADGLGEKYAERSVLKVKAFPADWNLGRKAGPLRNIQMVEYATHLVAFWDGESTGTKNVIDLAREKGLKVRVVMIGPIKI